MKKEDRTILKFKVMFEKRPIWGLIVGLNVCVLIWMISVQEPVIFDMNTAALSSSTNYVTNTAPGAEIGLPVAAELIAQQQHVNNGFGRDPLSIHIPAQSNDYAADMSAVAPSLSTLNFSVNNTKLITFSYSGNEKGSTKTSDLSSDMQSFTSSLGTGVVHFKSKPTPTWDKLNAGTVSLPHSDFNQLIDLQNFQFLMPQPVCGNHIEALILIHSAPNNYEKRQVIRDTWASIIRHSPESPLRVLFLLGVVSSEQLQSNLYQENNIYRDIIQGSFIDSYRNMTYKHIMSFKWFLYNCAHAQILIKVDDDVYVNTPQIIKYIKERQRTQQKIMNEMEPNGTAATGTVTTTTTTAITPPNTTTGSFSIFHKLNIFGSATPTTSPESSFIAFNASKELFNHPKNLLFCQKNIGALVKRSYRSKWRVSFKEYQGRYYPPYCPGYAIIYSPDIILRLYKAAQNYKYFWIDDVHITGVLAQQTNSTITTSSHYVLHSDECDKILTGKTDLSKTEFIFAWHSISMQKIKLLWHLQSLDIQTPHESQRSRNDDEHFADNGISSFHTNTSARGSR